MRKSSGSGTGRGWAVFLWLVAFAAVETAGCGLFKIRDPVQPVLPKGCPRAAAVSPESVLVNFEYAMGCKGDGLVNYGDALAETYSLVLDQNDVPEIGNGLDSLSKSQDVDAQRILTSALPDSFHFVFGDPGSTKESGTTFSYFTMPYLLQLIRAQGDSFVVADTILGTADITLAEQQAGQWALTRWVDTRSEKYKSFGRWHGERVVVGAPEPGSVIN
jgi:hypothetical protein